MAKVDSCLRYYLQSGKHAGRSLAACLLEDITEWQSYYDRLPKDCYNKNQLHLALACLLPKIKALEPIKLCPVCGRRPVHLFSLKDCGGFFNPLNFKRVCCSDKNCVHTMEYWSGSKLKVLNFKSFNIRSRFGNKRPVNKTDLQELLAIVYELPDLSNDILAINYLQKRLSHARFKTA
ncbi:hypothetical protein COT94_00315 [Candidatus Falkowbacteria bacterium CG10_big_fil_rev_8_21_14_0_10_37_14]|uniref:Uncharacterized protein n=1 Tax=Candidatus Falkowbacteria bacterium CG10_big_fil_rev_8_21_14_0_10_37_14 TaxID=1974561 RepID=A0A2M6WUB2_9BACT|nr:MAG: hypothetical protein COT94_00315 [Candidatus Falkowbacteria bacterium CG10_big_fil_rev_8_21_14_0_10_37_14]